MDVVAGIKITAQDSAEVLSDQLLDHFSRPRVMVLRIANDGSGDAPDVAIAAIFSPPRFIGLHGGTRANLRFERIELGLHLCFHPMQQFHNLPTADRDPMEREEVHLDLSNGQTHHRAERWRSDWPSALRSVLALLPARASPQG